MMTKYYSDRLLQAYDMHCMAGCDYKKAAEHFGYSKGVTDIIRGVFNRFVKLNASLSDVQDYLEGNYLASTKALEYYIRFVGERDRQVSACDLASELQIYDVEALKCKLRGMTVNQPDLVYYTDTFGLDCLTIK